MRNDLDQKFATPAVLEARDKLEAVDKQLTALKDEFKSAELFATKQAPELDMQAGADAVRAGKEIKDPRAHTRKAEATLEELAAKVKAAELAYRIEREALYRTTVADREEWLGNAEPADAEARKRLASALVAARDALLTMSAVAGVRGFLRDFTAEGVGNRREALYRQRVAMSGRYWPSGGNVGFANPVKVDPNAAPTPLGLLDLLSRVLEEPQQPVYVPNPGEPAERFSRV